MWGGGPYITDTDNTNGGVYVAPPGQETAWDVAVNGSYAYVADSQRSLRQPLPR